MQLLLEHPHRGAVPRHPLLSGWVVAEHFNILKALWLVPRKADTIAVDTECTSQGCLRFMIHAINDAEYQT